MIRRWRLIVVWFGRYDLCQVKFSRQVAALLLTEVSAVTSFLVLTWTRLIWQKAESSPCLYLPGGSVGLTVWLQFTIACFAWGFQPQIFGSPGRLRPHLTQCVTGPHKTYCTCRMASKSVKWFKQGARMWQTTDRQTDHATEKCVGIAGIACAVRRNSA